jgi:hypothetical protein
MGRAVVPKKDLSAKIREYKQRAEECERRVGSETDPAIQKALLDTAQRWRELARSYEIVGRATQFPKPRK